MTFIPEWKLEAQKQIGGLQFRRKIIKKKVHPCWSGTVSIKTRQTYILHFNSRHPTSLCLVPLFSLFQQCDWLGWLGGCHGNQIPIRGPHAAKRDPEKEQPTLVTMATHLLGAHRRLVLSPRRRSLLCDWTSLTCSGYPFPFSSSPSRPFCVSRSVC